LIHELKASCPGLRSFSLTPDVTKVGWHGLNNADTKVAWEILGSYIQSIYKGTWDRACHVHYAGSILACKVILHHDLVSWILSLSR